MTGIVKEFIEALNAFNNKTAPYDVKGEVRRIEGKTAWVRLNGGIDETPVEMTINCVPGDVVRVRVGGGGAWITGNESAPPTDDKSAGQALLMAKGAGRAAGLAQEAAEAAEDTAKKKAKTFQTSGGGTPSPPYNVGDIWLLTYLGESNEQIHELYTCVTAKTEDEAYAEEDWQLSATDDATAAAALGIANSLLGWSEEVDAILAQVVTSTEFDAMTVDLEGRIKDLDWNGYLSLYGLDGGVPVVVIGNEQLSAYVMMATNASLGFYRNNGEGVESEPTAYFGLSTAQNLFGLISGVVEAQKYLTVGSFVFIANDDGGLTLKKVGA